MLTRNKKQGKMLHRVNICYILYCEFKTGMERINLHETFI